ncbi:hypothetical protein AMECASPLE_011710 [Ameca splendens]|uniref:CASP-like protein n=1 Tax=Ameca splendens TaxID=208324 RepID=A0ABV1A8S7_9TELE
MDQHPLTLLTPPSNQPLTMVHLPMIKKTSKTAFAEKESEPEVPMEEKSEDGIETTVLHTEAHSRSRSFLPSKLLLRVATMASLFAVQPTFAVQLNALRAFFTSVHQNV